MNLYLVTHPESGRTSSDDLLFVRIAGRLIPLTRSAVDRLAETRRREAGDADGDAGLVRGSSAG